MKKILIIAKDEKELEIYYDFLVDSFDKSITKNVISSMRKYGIISTSHYKIYLFLDGHSFCGFRTNYYIYHGDDKTYENEILKPLVNPFERKQIC